MFKINKKNMMDVSKKWLPDYFNNPKKEKRYVINECDDEIIVNKEDDIKVYFHDDNTIVFYENDDRIADVYLDDMYVKNFDNSKWEVELFDCADGTIEIQLWNKEKDTYMYWAIEKDGNDYAILGECGNENVFDNPKWRFNLKAGTYWDYEKEDHFDIVDLIKGKNV